MQIYVSNSESMSSLTQEDVVFIDEVVVLRDELQTFPVEFASSGGSR